MLRHRKNASERDEFELDETDERLLAAIDAELPWQALLEASGCAAEEAQRRLMRMFHLGVLEDDSAPASQGAGADDQDPFDGQPTGLLEMREPARSGVRTRVHSAEPVAPMPSAVPSLRPSETAALSEAQRATLEQADVLVLRMNALNHYELLEVSPDVAPDELRRAYGKLARRFHPDSFFRKPIGDSRAKLEHIFTTLTQAYDVLRDAEQRAGYDSSLGLAPKPEPLPTRVVATFARVPAPSPTHAPRPIVTRSIAPEPPRSSAPPRARVPAARPGPSVKVQPPAPSAPPRASTTRNDGTNMVISAPPPPRPSDVSAGKANAPRANCESLLRDLRMRRLGGRPETPAVSVRPGAAQAEQTPGGLSGSPYASTIDALARELARGDAGARRAGAGLLRVRELEQQGELLSALSVLQLVVSSYPDVRLRELRDRLKERAQKAGSSDHRARAIAAQDDKNFAQAAEHWRKVAEADRSDAKAPLQAAICYLQAREIKQAGPWAQRAVELSPNDVLARRVLLRFYEAMGMERNAARERQALAKLRGA